MDTIFRVGAPKRDHTGRSTMRAFIGRGWAIVKRRPWRVGAGVLMLAFAALNFVAYRMAHGMMFFEGRGNRTPQPQNLSLAGKAKVLVCGVNIPRPANYREPDEFSLRSETVRFVSEDNVHLEAWLITPGRPKGTVLLFHGYAATRSSILDQARVFNDLGYATLLTDFRGSGGSEGHVTTVGYNEAHDVAAAVRFARDKNLPTPLVLYGHSMGGAAVMRSIATLDVKPDAIIVEAVFNRMVDTVANRFRLMGLPAFPAAQLLIFWGGLQTGISGFAHNPEDYARACDCDALVLHGVEDPNARLRECEAVYGNLAGKKTMVRFDGAGHQSLVVANRTRWKSAVQEFLSGVRDQH